MEEFEDIATYFLRIDEVVNTMRGLGETIENGIIVQKVLRYLPAIFYPKIYCVQAATKSTKGLCEGKNLCKVFIYVTSC